MKTIPTLDYEKELWAKYQIVIGVDEVGRGPLAGPIVAAAYSATPLIQSSKVKFNNGIIINDSKKLTPKQREKSSEWLINNCLGYAIAQVEVNVINRIGVGRANILAMRRAVISLIKKLECSNFFVLSDYFKIPNLEKLGLMGQDNLVKGDAKSFSIAAASIIAKVYRDNLMMRLASNYPQYGWGRNKGYGTAEHLDSLRQYGKTEYHRDLFVQKYI